MVPQPGSTSREQAEQAHWAAANASSRTPQDTSEAISKMEAMELARSQAEQQAKRDEEEWREEELNLQEQEDARRMRRQVEEEEDWEEEVKEWEAEKRVLALVLDARSAAPAGFHPSLDPTDSPFDGAAAAGASSSITAEVQRTDEAAAAVEAVAELLRCEANRSCFDCEAELCLPSAVAPPPRARASDSAGAGEDADEGGEDALRASLWLCTSHGVLLCEACARVHCSLDKDVSCVRAYDSALLLTELDTCFAGGNDAFATYLAEEVGVPRHVWLALPLEARYATPAAQLYQRRLRAFMRGEELPSNLFVPDTSQLV